MWGFVLFCFVLTLALVPLGWGAAFLIALVVQGAAQSLMLVALRARVKRGFRGERKAGNDEQLDSRRS